MAEQDQEVREWIRRQRKARHERHVQGRPDPDRIAVSAEFHAKLERSNDSVNASLGGAHTHGGPLTFCGIPVVVEAQELEPCKTAS